MKIRLLAVGQRPPRWVQEGFDDFARRLPSHLSLELVEIPSQHRKAGTVHKIREREADKILAALTPRDWVVLLDENGATWRTDQFAAELEGWLEAGRPLTLIIGGADGVHEGVRQRADQTVSLAFGTYPHALVRVMLAEQLYRAWTVTAGHPYHRA